MSSPFRSGRSGLIQTLLSLPVTRVLGPAALGEKKKKKDARALPWGSCGLGGNERPRGQFFAGWRRSVRQEWSGRPLEEGQVLNNVLKNRKKDFGGREGEDRIVS